MNRTRSRTRRVVKVLKVVKGKTKKAQDSISRSPASPLSPPPVEPPNPQRAEVAKLAREFATWAVGESDRVLIEIRKSELAAQLRDMGVGRGTAILKSATQAVEEERQDEANRQLMEELTAQRAAEALNWFEEVTAKVGSVADSPRLRRLSNSVRPFNGRPAVSSAVSFSRHSVNPCANCYGTDAQDFA